MTMKTTGYIIEDRYGDIIVANGTTLEEAKTMVIEGNHPFFTANGKKAEYEIWPATASLIENIKSMSFGTWDILDGIACTAEEADQVYRAVINT